MRYPNFLLEISFLFDFSPNFISILFTNNNYYFSGSDISHQYKISSHSVASYGLFFLNIILTNFYNIHHNHHMFPTDAHYPNMVCIDWDNVQHTQMYNLLMVYQECG